MSCWDCLFIEEGACNLVVGHLIISEGINRGGNTGIKGTGDGNGRNGA